MKKLFVFSFFAFHFSLLVLSQDTITHPNRIYSGKALTISFGQGRPLGSFSFGNVNTASAPNQSKGYAYGNSFADPGGELDISFNYPIKKSGIGLTFSLGYNGNGFDNNRFASLYVPQKSPYNYTYTTSSTQYYASSDIYGITSLLTGITYTYTVGKFLFNIKILAGPLLCSTPGISFTQATPYVINASNTLISTESILSDSILSASVFALAVSGGIGVGYHLTKRIYLIANCNYLYSQITFHATTKTFYDNGGQLSFNSLVSTSTSSITIPISLLNITVGLKFLL